MKKKEINTFFHKVILLVLMVIFISGCTYYRVTDPSTDRVYYTTEVEELRSGAVKLKDAKTQRTVTVTNSEVEQISEDEYKQGLSEEKPLDKLQSEDEDEPLDKVQSEDEDEPLDKLQSESEDKPQNESK